MQEQDIIEHLRAGWELANRGTGWYLSAPRKLYQKEVHHQIPVEVVKGMELAGVIRTSIPYNTIRAELVEQQS